MSQIQNTTMTLRHFTTVTLPGIALLFSSCAGSGGGKTGYTTAPAAGAALNNADRVSVQVTAAPALSMTSAEKARVGDRITSVLNTKRAALPGKARTVSVSVDMTRYDRGSAFARAMLAGLGQIHIDATVTASTSGQVLMSFPVKKTFAWGGMMGAVTSIADVEVGFAEKVAAGLTGQP